MSPAPPADPVQELMARHRSLCEGAAGPLEIAAHLEAEGFGPRTAHARTRHADVFPLAEELYARVPRVPPSPERPRVARPWRPLARTLLCAAVTAVVLLLRAPGLWSAALLCLPLGVCLVLGRPVPLPPGEGGPSPWARFRPAAPRAGALPAGWRAPRPAGGSAPRARGLRGAEAPELLIAAVDLAVLAAGAAGAARAGTGAARNSLALVVLAVAAQAVAWAVASAGRRHLLARSRGDFRSRMSAVLALGLVVDAAAAAAGSPQQAGAGLLLALCLLLRALGHALPALLGAAVGAAVVLIRAPVGWGLALAAVLTAATWVLALRPESYRGELAVPL